ncbi:MAG: hypothetical protein H6Q90_633 [Deltaproteobacteria bacterium]|nr:hypothetical protein [Deltaproteobacteria bacterium]
MRHASVIAMCPGEETIAAYLAGRLAIAERDAFDSHLDTCSLCHELLAALGKGAQPRAESSATSLGVGPSLGVGSTDEVTDPTSLPAGHPLGRYVLLARLGAGGMGVVYAAYDPELDRKIALKILRRADAAGTRLRDEARAIARLAHPNVVAVHDVGEADGEVFVAMEHVDGSTLRDWLRTPRTPAEILAVFAQAGAGLAAAHAVGLVHRDVKPSNLIVGKDGRARVLDFGLARRHAIGDDEDGPLVGTPAYMAPEQQRGGRADARADQFAFCVSLWEALAGERPAPDPAVAARGTIAGVGARTMRALRRGLAARPEDRFPTMGSLLQELVPAPRKRWRWAIAIFLAGGTLAAAGFAVFTGGGATPSCARAGDPVTRVWGGPQRTALRAAFGATHLPYADTAADEAIAQLDAWTLRWQRSAEASCRATAIDRVQPAELEGLRRSCLDQLVERLEPLVALAEAATPAIIAKADALAAALPGPERCDDTAALIAISPPSEASRVEVGALRAAIARTEAEIFGGRGEQVRAEVGVLQRKAEALAYPPLRARARFLGARLDQALAHYDQAIAGLHAAAREATAARDLEQLAEIWIDLTQTLGNDQRTLDQAAVFDGYAESLVALLPDRDALGLQLEFARCNRNRDSSKPDDVATLAHHCETTIAAAERARPPRLAIANAARTRLGHFQRLLGQDAQAHATLVAAVAEAVRVHGELHPDTAVARYSLGIAELAADRLEAGITELRQALAIRRAAFAGNNLQVAESLQGLGDALATKGEHREAIALFDEALAMAEALGQGTSALAANCHILDGMSLEEVQRDDDALTHYLRAADIADRTLQHSEPLAAMGLRLAADVSGRHGHAPVGVLHLERALRLLERARAAPIEVGTTQQRLSEVLLRIPAERARARAMAEAARASFVTAGKAGAPALAELDAYLRKQGWR